MKKITRRLLALGLTAALLLPPAASASLALGTEIHNGTSTIGQGLTETTQTLWSATYSDLRTERYLTYTPNPGTSPAVVYGSTVLGKATLSAMAKGLEGYGRRVLGGTNGDYFVVATGAPLGIVVTNGILRSSASYHFAVGFLPDGSAFAGQPSLTIRAAFHGSMAGIAGVNKVREPEGGYFLFTSDFGPNTQNSSPGVDVILSPVLNEEGEAAPLTIGGQVSYVVEEVLHSTREVAIPAGGAVLSVNLKSGEEAVAVLDALVPGDVVDISVNCADPRWSEVVSAIGGLYKLVTDGVVVQGLEQAAAPRTAIGVLPDGGTILYTIDGRRPGYSVGASMEQVAKRLVELGCVDAILLDGGGSTTFGTTSAVENSFSVDNRPSDGVQRAVTNAIFFVSNLEATGEVDSLHVYPNDALMLSGASLALGAIAIDSGYYPMWPVNGARYTASEGGAVDDAGVLTVSGGSGVVSVRAELGTAAGEGTFTVIDTPDKITVSDALTGHAVTAVNLEPYESIDLTASAEYRKLDVLSDDVCYTWTVSERVGTVDEFGVLTAGAEGAVGMLSVQAGGRSVAIPVSVAGHILTLEEFEDGFNRMVGTDSIEIFEERSAAHVRYGKGSMRMDYVIPQDGKAVLYAPVELAAGESCLGLWVYGDESGNILAASVIDGAGEVHEVPLTILDFAGWQQVMVPLPVFATALRALMIESGGEETTAGTVWIDQMVSANQYVIDLLPPEVSMAVTGGRVTATVSDDVDRRMDGARVVLTYDGVPMESVWDMQTGKLTGTLPAADGKGHRVTVTATDTSGNIARASADIARTGDAQPPFDDIEGHWAREYAEYLWDQGISNGQMVGESRVFLPDNNITRGEFTLMVARWMGVDLAQHTGAALPFIDTDDIPAWAREGIGAMHALGVFQGSFQGDGVYAYANNTITRAEAMTILGRIQAKGYLTAEADFIDAGEIPAWALDYVKTLVAQGVVAGYDGLLRPGDPVRRGEVAKLLYTLD